MSNYAEHSKRLEHRAKVVDRPSPWETAERLVISRVVTEVQPKGRPQMTTPGEITPRKAARRLTLDYPVPEADAGPGGSVFVRHGGDLVEHLWRDLTPTRFSTVRTCQGCRLDFQTDELADFRGAPSRKGSPRLFCSDSCRKRRASRPVEIGAALVDILEELDGLGIATVDDSTRGLRAAIGTAARLADELGLEGSTVDEILEALAARLEAESLPAISAPVAASVVTS